MSDTLERRSFDPPRAEIRRLVIALLCLGMASVCWYVLRPRLVDPLALSGIGGQGREELLARALLARSTPGFPDRNSFSEEFQQRWIQVTSWSLPEPGWVQWSRVHPGTSKGLTSWDEGTTGFTDHLLHPRGLLSVKYGPDAPPGDMDSDGRWEVLTSYEAVPNQDFKTRAVFGSVLIRLGNSDNEIAWAGLLNYEAWSNRGIYPGPLWRDEDGDGVKELVFLTITYVRLPNGDTGYGPAQTAAVFAWDRPGGVLRPRMLPPDGSFLSWTPPDGKPVKVAQEADLDPILRKLFPVPDSFGYGGTAATRPTTAPQAANSAPSGYDSHP